MTEFFLVEQNSISIMYGHSTFGTLKFWVNFKIENRAIVLGNFVTPLSNCMNALAKDCIEVTLLEGLSNYSF